MQVVHDNTGITHAVLGKGEVIDFKASTSAQVLFLLSTGLYKYPKLAAVREIICNAWDAHISASVRDIPVKIEINEKGVLSVRDFGPGIPHDKIGDIYCTAGDSTKVQSDDETGGFGLGSKAPFAYRDHFGVVSHNGGYRTMYSMAMSDSQSMGKPTAKVLHRGESSETGLEVTLQLKTEDVQSFKRIIRDVVYLGDINATLDGEVLPVCGMDNAGSDVSFVTEARELPVYGRTDIGIRYGAVVYPLDFMSDFSEEFHAVTTLIKKKFGGYRDYMLILRADSHSVSMVPSREALLYNPRTIKTVKQLLMNALKILSETLAQDKRKYIAKIIERFAANGWAPSDMMLAKVHGGWPTVAWSPKEEYNRGLSDIFVGTRTQAFDADVVLDNSNAHTLEQFTMWYVIFNFRELMNDLNTRSFYTNRLLDLATKFGRFRNEQIVRTYGKAQMKPNHQHMRRTLLNCITKPYLRAMRGLVDDPQKRMFAFDTNKSSGSTNWSNGSGMLYDAWNKSVFNALPEGRKGMLALANPLFILVWNHRTAERFSRVWYTTRVQNPAHYVVYVIKLDRKKHDSIAIQRSLMKYGFDVINNTEAQTDLIEYELEEQRKKNQELRAGIEKGLIKEPVKRATKDEIAGLCNVFYDKDQVNLDRWQSAKSIVLMKSPEAILVRKANPNEPQTLPGLNIATSKWLLKRYMHVTGITNREATAKRFYSAGATPFNVHVAKDFMHQISTNPRILQTIVDVSYMYDQLTKLENLSRYVQTVVENALTLDDFRKHFGLPIPTEEEKMWKEFYEEITSGYWSRQWKIDLQAVKVLKPEKPSKEVTNFIAKLRNNTNLSGRFFAALYSIERSSLAKMQDDEKKIFSNLVIQLINR